MLNNEEKKELKTLARSPEFRNDMQRLSAAAHNPFVKDGVISVDKFLIFLTEFNQFINHRPKHFRKIIDTDMRL